MELEDEEKDLKAASAPTIEGEVPCASPPVDKDERSDRIKTICDPTTTSMKIPTMLDEDTASLFLSSSVAAQSDAPATSVTKKKAKKKAMYLSSVVGARITEEQLSAQDPSNTPKDCKTPGKYHPVCVATWKAWLNFVQVFLNKQTNDGRVLHLVPPLLPWDAPHDSSIIVLLMHYMPTQLTNLEREICILQVQNVPMDPLDLIVGSLFVNLLEMDCTRFDV